MRLGVLDVGSNTVHLLVMDAHHGARPWAAHSDKTELRLVDHLNKSGGLSSTGRIALTAAIAHAQAVAEQTKAEELLAFATSALRDATNAEEVLESIRAETGVDLQVLAGEDEARLTFLAARRWFGWSAGRLLLLDIGGGSLELATGVDEEPDAAISVPLGAARLTRSVLADDPPKVSAVAGLRQKAAEVIAGVCGPMHEAGPPDRVVGTSKTFKQLARIAGAAPSSEGHYVRRVLTRADVTEWVDKLTKMKVSERAALPGVSAGRAQQLLAGAIVAEAAMNNFGIDELEICPWALREGVILRRLDWIRESGA
jgi:exopolyphosphatase/guanosine-5'-triphosphate,3'-diphosphate pyrophosphatase